MKGLLLKDFYNIRKQAGWYAGMIVLFCALSVVLKNAAFAGTIGILAATAVPLSAVAYEEKDGWQKFAAAGGISARTAVAEKYLLGALAALFGCIGYFASLAVLAAMGSGTENAAEWVLPVCMQFISLSVVLPLVFRFGVEKGRTYMTVAIVLFLLAIVGLFPLLGNLLADGRIALAVGAACFTALLLAASCAVSVRIYSKKEF
ncbi:MAG TPA: ABC-2 transporter permease [Candidatus Scatosoma pullicola]|nr:ABC-2 transporter permease [Candidatus Scatosoma pullicola]